jgi:hypothetical protein
VARRTDGRQASLFGATAGQTSIVAAVGRSNDLRLPGCLFARLTSRASLHRW